MILVLYNHCAKLEISQVSRIQLESGDKLARLSLEIEGENESKLEADRKIKEMRADVSRPLSYFHFHFPCAQQSP